MVRWGQAGSGAARRGESWQGTAWHGERAGGDSSTLARMIVAGLAGTRLVRAWMYETIGEKPREALLEWLDKPVMRKLPVAGHSRATDEVHVKLTGLKEWAGELFDCPHCFGFWLTVGCSFGLRHRWTRPVVEALAGAMILSVVAQWMPGFDFEEPDPPDPVKVELTTE